jgi:hypothetical protein
MAASQVTEFDLSSFPESAPSICIPRVFSNITKARVEAIFRNLDFGDIERVDMVQRVNDNGDRFQRVFVHFKRWNDDEQSEKVRQMLLADQEVKVVYDDPWFWKLRASKSTRPEDRPKQKKRVAPFVDFTAKKFKQMNVPHRSGWTDCKKKLESMLSPEEMKWIAGEVPRTLEEEQNWLASGSLKEVQDKLDERDYKLDERDWCHWLAESTKSVGKSYNKSGVIIPRPDPELQEWMRKLYNNPSRAFLDYLARLKEHPRFDEFSSYPPGHPLYNYIHGGYWCREEEIEPWWNCNEYGIPYHE